MNQMNPKVKEIYLELLGNNHKITYWTDGNTWDIILPVNIAKRLVKDMEQKKERNGG